MKTRYIDPELVRQSLSYDPETGVFRWRRRGDVPESVNTIHAGSIAGSVLVDKYGFKRKTINLRGRTYKQHRLAWVYMTGEQPPSQIDHINRDALDNRWDNLRDGTKNNQKNRSLNRNNRTGLSGVRLRSPGKWEAVGRENRDGKQKAVRIGIFDSFEAAAEARLAWLSERGYSPEHGKRVSPHVEGVDHGR